jgi:phage-related protein
MAEVGTAYLSVIPSFKGGAKGIANALDGRGVGTGVGKGMGTGMAAAVGGMAAKIFAPLAVVGGAVALGGWLKGAVSEATDLGESINAVNVVYGKAAAGVQELGEASSTALGLSNVEFNSLAVRFSSFAETVAGKGGDVVGTLDDLTTRASDFASVMNLDVAEAAELFQSGLAGETEPLRQYGIDLSAAAVENYALAQGIATSAGSMTEAQKVQARYGLLMQSTAKTAGDFANTSGSLANQTRIWGAGMANVSAIVGSALLPALEGIAQVGTGKILPFLTNAAEGFKGFADGIYAAIERAGGGWDGLVTAAQAGFQKLLAWLTTGGVETILNGILAGRQALFDAALTVFPVILNAAMTILPQLVTWITGTLIPSLITVVTTLVPQLATLLATLLPQLATTLTTLLPMLLQAAITLFSSLIQALVTILPTLISTVLGLLPVLVTTILTMLPQLLSAGVDLFLMLVQAVLEVLPKILTVLIGTVLPNLLTTILGMIPQLVTTAIELFLSLVTGILKALPQIIAALIDVLPVLISTLVGMIPQLVVAAVQVFLALVTGIGQALPEILSALASLGGDIIAELGNIDLIDVGRQLMEGLKSGISEAASGLVDAVLEPVQDAVAGVKDFLGIHSPSRLFAEIGTNTMLGLTGGIEGEVPSLSRTMSGVTAAIESGVAPSLHVGLGADDEVGAMAAAVGAPLVGQMVVRDEQTAVRELEGLRRRALIQARLEVRR